MVTVAQNFLTQVYEIQTSDLVLSIDINQKGETSIKKIDVCKIWMGYGTYIWDFLYGLVGLFEGFGFQNNASKTIAKIYTPSCLWGGGSHRS